MTRCEHRQHARRGRAAHGDGRSPSLSRTTSAARSLRPSDVLSLTTTSWVLRPRGGSYPLQRHNDSVVVCSHRWIPRRGGCRGVSMWRRGMRSWRGSGWTERGRRLLDGLADAVALLTAAGCRRVWLNGSFVTAKDEPGDFDACWERPSRSRRPHPVCSDLRTVAESTRTGSAESSSRTWWSPGVVSCSWSSSRTSVTRAAKASSS